MQKLIDRGVWIEIVCMSKKCSRRGGLFFQGSRKQKVDEFSGNIFTKKRDYVIFVDKSQSPE